MVLYHVVTYYQLLWVIVYHRTQKKDAKAVILMASSLETRLSKEIIIRLREFFEIHFFPYEQIKDHINTKTIDELVQKVESRVIELYEKHIGYDLAEFEEINIAGYHFYFSLLLLNKNIEFNVIEEAAGMLSRHDVLYSIVENLNPFQLKIALYNKLLYADHPLIQKRFCNVNCQVDNFEGVNLSHFDLMLELRQNTSLVKLLVEIFIGEFTKYPNRKDSVLLLTQHFANLKILSFEEQALIYQYIIDYFFEGKQLIIKPHPDDVMFYSKLFTDSYIIREKFPSELLPFVFEEIPDYVSTVSSTAIYSIASAFDNDIQFSNDTEKNFKLLNRYYVALMIFNRMHKLNYLQCLNCDRDIIQNLLKYSDISNENVELIYCNDINELDYDLPILIGDCDGDYFSEENLINHAEIKSIMILNCNYRYNEVSQVQLDSNVVIPISVEKKRIKLDYFYADEETEIFYYISTLEENRKMVNDISLEKTLNYTGVQIKKEKLTESQIELMVTKGILKSTEMRLNFLLEKNKELTEEINELKQAKTTE